MPPLSTTRMRLERLGDERDRLYDKIEETHKLAEAEARPHDELEQNHLASWRTQVVEIEEEIELLSDDLKRAEAGREISELLRSPEPAATVGGDDGPTVYRTFAAFARDTLIVRYPLIASAAAGDPSREVAVREAAAERLARVQNTLTSDIAGLLPPQHIAQIMDIINKTRPVVQSGRFVGLTSGRLTYPRITGRPESLKQSAEKTEAGTARMSVVLDTVNADTYLGAGDLSWQTINWSTPDALQLWFDLAAEAYARSTETAACSELGTAGGGTISTPLGTAGTESVAQWRAAILAWLKSIYNTTGGRAMSDTLSLSADRFLQLAGLGTDQVLQVSAVGNLDVGSMTGTYAGLRLIGSYGFGTGSSVAVIGDASALLVSESPGAPVEMRVVEPAIGGMECGVIGGFKAKVFDSNRFIHLS